MKDYFLSSTSLISSCIRNLGRLVRFKMLDPLRGKNRKKNIRKNERKRNYVNSLWKKKQSFTRLLLLFSILLLSLTSVNFKLRVYLQYLHWEKFFEKFLIATDFFNWGLNFSFKYRQTCGSLTNRESDKTNRWSNFSFYKSQCNFGCFY